MSTLRFDGRVAVVTGAGRGIGRAYAHLLAERGAQVVVNDLGGRMDGEGSDTAPAVAVADEIVSEGGQAIADTHDISATEGGTALIDAAVDTYGRIDIVVNNAGIIRYAAPPEVDAANLEAHLAVHVVGSFNTALAAWPHMVDQGYGRIVMTTSSGMLGLPNNLGYATAKAGVIGMTRSLAVAGRKLGITVNLIAPAAFTRMAGTSPDAPEPTDAEAAATPMAPELVAPMVAYLAHEVCPVTGAIYAAGAGRFARMFIAAAPGYVHVGGAATVEDVAAHWDEINDETGYTVPTSTASWSRAFLEHLPPDAF
ncbi:MAG: SDR family NAD(P)-dependent oxidoreductase [Acidimicrobiia bacterium]